MAKSVVETTIELLGKLDPSVQKVMGQAQKAASKTGDAIGKALSAGFKVGVAAAGAVTTALVKIGTEYQSATGQISAAMIQRKHRVGYARAGRILDQMEKRGFISGFEGSKPRQTRITREQFYQLAGVEPDAPAYHDDEE